MKKRGRGEWVNDRVGNGAEKCSFLSIIVFLCVSVLPLKLKGCSRKWVGFLKRRKDNIQGLFNKIFV